MNKTLKRMGERERENNNTTGWTTPFWGCIGTVTIDTVVAVDAAVTVAVAVAVVVVVAVVAAVEVV